MTLAATLGSRFALLLGGRVALLVLALVSTAMLTRILEPTGFGHYRTAMAYLALVIALADLGLSSLFVREISRPGADQPRLIANLLGLRLALAGAALAFASGLAFLLPLDAQGRLGIVGGSFGFLAYSLHLLLFGLFQQKLRQQGVVLAEITGGLVLVGLIIVFAWAGAEPFWFVVAMGLSYIATLALTFVAAQRLVRFGLRLEPALWLDLARQAAPLAVATTISVLYFRADTVLLAFFRAPAEVGLYGVPVKVLDSCMGISMLLVGLFTPLMAHSARVDEVAFRDHLGTGLLTLAAGTTLVGVGLVALAPEIVTLLAGAEFTGGASILQVLAGVLVLHGTAVILREAATALTIQQRLLPAYFAGLGVAMVAYVMLIPRFGGIGAAAALLLAEIVVVLLTGSIVARAATGLAVMRRPLMALGCGLVAAVLTVVAERSGVHWFLRGLLAGVTYLTLLLGTRTLQLPALISLGRDMLARKNA